MSTVKLSPVQLEVIKKIQQHDNILERWQGGFWTYQGAEIKHTIQESNREVPVPVWYYGTNTVHSLIKKNVFLVLESGNYGAVKVGLNPHPSEWLVK